MDIPPRPHRPHRPARRWLILLSCLLSLASGISEAQTRLQPASPLGKDRRLNQTSPVPARPATGPAITTRPDARAKALTPVLVARSPDTYLGRPIRVSGAPKVTLDAATGKWTGTTSGLPVELTPAAKAHLDAARIAGQSPVFRAELIRRDGKLLLTYSGPDR